MLALLNSKLYYIWLYNKGKRKGDMLEFYQKPLSEVPIKKIPAICQKPFISKAEEIIEAKMNNAKADTSSLEAEIDQMVYELYDLTDEEIRLVEGSAS